MAGARSEVDGGGVDPMIVIPGRDEVASHRTTDRAYEFRVRVSRRIPE